MATVIIINHSKISADCKTNIFSTINQRNKKKQTNTLFILESARSFLNSNHNLNGDVHDT